MGGGAVTAMQTGSATEPVGTLPDVAVAPAAGELAGHVELHRHPEDVDRALLVRCADEARRRERRQRALPAPPAVGGVERDALVGRAERAEVVGAAYDPLDGGHHRAAVTAAAVARAHADALDVAAPQRAAA